MRPRQDKRVRGSAQNGSAIRGDRVHAPVVSLSGIQFSLERTQVYFWTGCEVSPDELGPFGILRDRDSIQIVTLQTMPFQQRIPLGCDARDWGRRSQSIGRETKENP